MKKYIVLIGTVMVLFALSIHAEADPADTQFYIGGGASYAWENFDTDNLEDANINVDVDDAWGINLFGGYRFTRNLALEGNFNWYDDFDLDATRGAIRVNAEVKIWTLMVDLKAMYPTYDDKLVPYLRIGGGIMDAEIDVGTIDDDESDFAWNLGGGLDYFVNDQISLGLDAKYVWGTGDLDELEYFVGTASVSYHF